MVLASCNPFTSPSIPDLFDSAFNQNQRSLTLLFYYIKSSPENPSLTPPGSCIFTQHPILKINVSSLHTKIGILVQKAVSLKPLLLPIIISLGMMAHLFSEVKGLDVEWYSRKMLKSCVGLCEKRQLNLPSAVE